MPRQNRSTSSATVTEIKPASELDKTIEAINRNYNNSTVIKGSQMRQPPRIPSGVFIFDFATLGGIPRNRITTILGVRHSGKSMFGAMLAGQAQNCMEGTVAWLDIEGTFEPTWAEKLGVDTDGLLLSQPDTGEQAVDIAEALGRSRETSLIVIDSLGQLTPYNELEKSASDPETIGQQSRLIGKLVRRVTSAMIEERKRGHQVTFLFINQWRSDIGGFARFGTPTKQPGGFVAEHAPTLQFVMKNKEQMGKDANEVEAVRENQHAFTFQKNKLNGGPRTGEFRLARIDLPELGLIEGQPDNGTTILAYAKKFKCWVKDGKNQSLVCGQHKWTFAKQDQFVRAVNEDQEMQSIATRFLIGRQAQSLKMPEDFVAQYLEGFDL